MSEIRSGYAQVNGARLYYEVAGAGTPLLMIHAGIADCRMWQNEFTALRDAFQVIRFDMRGHGRSLPVPGDYNIQDDLRALLQALDVEPPLILMGCSIGAGLAMDYAFCHADEVQALILVGGAPGDLELDVEEPAALFAQSESAMRAGDVEQVAELDMRIWFDGFGRVPQQVNQAARKQAYEMARRVTEHELQGIGTHVRKSFAKTGSERLADLTMPTLLVIGENDLPYLVAAADYMLERLPRARKCLLPDAAHLPNMEHPQRFQAALRGFLAGISNAAT